MCNDPVQYALMQHACHGCDYFSWSRLGWHGREDLSRPASAATAISSVVPVAGCHSAGMAGAGFQGRSGALPRAPCSRPGCLSCWAGSFAAPAQAQLLAGAVPNMQAASISDLINFLAKSGFGRDFTRFIVLLEPSAQHRKKGKFDVQVLLPSHVGCTCTYL